MARSLHFVQLGHGLTAAPGDGAIADLLVALTLSPDSVAKKVPNQLEAKS